MIFTCHFLGWDPEYTTKSTFVDPYEKKMAEKKAAKASADQAKFNSDRSTVVDAPEQERPSAWKTNSDAEARAKAVRDAEERRLKRLSVSANMDVVANPPPIPAAAKSKDYDDPSAKSYTVEELKTKLPQVNPASKEQYLSDADFEALFKTDKASFLAQPKWKQANAKKLHGLF